jgi:predicted nuclease of predicted toxin-antitoxin system
MRFMLDENVPAEMADMLVAGGHEAEFIRDYVPPGAADPLVATVAEQNNSILISFDGDFQLIAPRIPIGHRRRFRRLSRIWMRCGEPQGARRLESALELVKSEFALGQRRTNQRMMFWVGISYLRTER